MVRKQNQKSFWKTPIKAHGGELARGKRKTARPLATKRPLHVTLRSTRARGQWSLLRHDREIETILHSLAKRFRIRLYRRQNVGNHLHLLLQGSRRADLQNFLRVLPQAIMFLVTKARKGNPVGKFWDNLVWTRVVEWGRDWKSALRYLDKNQFEAAGVPRKFIDKIFEELSGFT